jgi:hypothetical protein
MHTNFHSAAAPQPNFLCPFGAGLRKSSIFPRVPLRSTRGYSPWPRWGRFSEKTMEVESRFSEKTMEVENQFFEKMMEVEGL